MMEQKNEQPRLTDILGEVREEICDQYCRFNYEARTYNTKEEWEALEKKCLNCPLTVKL